MNNTNENTLVQKHPVLFRDWRGDPKQTCMAWGLETPDGWYVPIYVLCNTIKRIVENLNRQAPEIGFIVVADQVKEKFGTLRFYWHSECTGIVFPQELTPEQQVLVDRAYEQVIGAVDMCEGLTAHICNRCGAANLFTPRNDEDYSWGNQCVACDLIVQREVAQRDAEWAAKKAKKAEKAEADANNEEFRKTH